MEDKMATYSPSAFGIEIRTCRERLGLTQRQFGELCGVGGKYPHVAISDLETGFRQNAHAGTTAKIKRILDANPASISERHTGIERHVPMPNRSLGDLIREINSQGFAVTLTPLPQAKYSGKDSA
jgi:transcriptional regulator with XRE-family HTH domain